MHKNKCFIDAFDKIKPSFEEKEKIYQNLLHHSSKRLFFTKARTLSLGVFTLFLFFLYSTTVQEVPSNRTRISPMSISYNEISFNGKCYQETVISNKMIGDYWGVMEQENRSYLLYAHQKDERIVFLLKGGEYIPYEEVVCK